jgi:hypothetical protein
MGSNDLHAVANLLVAGISFFQTAKAKYVVATPVQCRHMLNACVKVSDDSGKLGGC